MRQPDLAHDLARKLLEEPLPRRWAHTQGVAAQAETLALILGDDADLLTAAAWLHDIGYSPDLVDTGFHPLDGARYLRDVENADDLLCRLVAHHSCAIIEAEERGLADELTREFLPPHQDLLDALTYCDMTTSPDGACVTVEERIVDIRERYFCHDVVTHSFIRAAESLARAVTATEKRRITRESSYRTTSPSPSSF